MSTSGSCTKTDGNNKILKDVNLDFFWGSFNVNENKDSAIVKIKTDISPRFDHVPGRSAEVEEHPLWCLISLYYPLENSASKTFKGRCIFSTKE